MIFTRHEFMEMGKKVWIFLNFVANTLNVSILSLAPNGPEKWGCRIRDLFSKIRDLFSKFETYAVIRDYETKKTAGAAEPTEPPSLAPMII